MTNENTFFHQLCYLSLQCSRGVDFVFRKKTNPYEIIYKVSEVQSKLVVTLHQNDKIILQSMRSLLHQK